MYVRFPITVLATLFVTSAITSVHRCKGKNTYLLHTHLVLAAAVNEEIGTLLILDVRQFLFP
jgi:hypothetical protein